MENIEQIKSIARLENEMENINEWLKDHKRFHEKLLENQTKNKRALWLFGLGLLGSSILNLLKDYL